MPDCPNVRRRKISISTAAAGSAGCFKGCPPSNTVSAGPVIYTEPWGSHRILRVPPGRRTVALRPEIQPFRTAATAAAQAPVPQASVSPDPLFPDTHLKGFVIQDLYKLRVDPVGENPDNAQNSGPSRPRSSFSGSSTGTTAWGFPMDTAVLPVILSPNADGHLQRCSRSVRTGILEARNLRGSHNLPALPRPCGLSPSAKAFLPRFRSPP